MLCLFHGLFVLTIKNDVSSLTFTNAARPRLNGKHPERAFRMLMLKWDTLLYTSRQFNVSEEDFRQTVAETTNRVPPLPPLTAISRRCVCGIFSCAVCDSCWDSGLNRPRISYIEHSHGHTCKWLFIRSWHNGRETNERDGRVNV